ncbi:hypothetical protein L208DRAFT_585774 [Tricholoma matsutake]|nr:hypothetical protein L208DRAFT_585774 [Tricholoma matsutake 945]
MFWTCFHVTTSSSIEYTVYQAAFEETFIILAYKAVAVTIFCYRNPRQPDVRRQDRVL